VIVAVVSFYRNCGCWPRRDSYVLDGVDEIYYGRVVNITDSVSYAGFDVCGEVVMG
jgi:hypothetical protein